MEAHNEDLTSQLGEFIKSKSEVDELYRLSQAEVSGLTSGLAIAQENASHHSSSSSSSSSSNCSGSVDNEDLTSGSSSISRPKYRV